MKDTILHGVSGELGYFLKRQLVQPRALSIESDEELLSVYLPREIKECLKKEAEEKGTNMQEIAEKIIKKTYDPDQNRR